MSNTSPIALILGAGANVGQHVARAFAARGYILALAARSLKEEDSTADQIHIAGDLSDPNSIIEVFSKVKARLGTPSVVIYNAAAVTPSDAKNPFSVSVTDFTRDLNINSVSTFVAIQQAVLGFEQLPDSLSKTFIYTGNILNNTTMPSLLTLGVGKSATAHMIEVAASAYADQGYKFYYADERKDDGSPAYFDISGDAHGTHYVELAESKSQQPWQQTFVKGVGYKKF